MLDGLSESMRGALLGGLAIGAGALVMVGIDRTRRTSTGIWASTA